MSSGAMIYTPSFFKIALGIQKLMGVEDSQTQPLRLHGDLISLLFILKIRNLGIKILKYKPKATKDRKIAEELNRTVIKIWCRNRSVRLQKKNLFVVRFEVPMTMTMKSTSSAM
jgi:hypothetical protein